MFYKVNGIKYLETEGVRRDEIISEVKSLVELFTKLVGTGFSNWCYFFRWQLPTLIDSLREGFLP